MKFIASIELRNGGVTRAFKGEINGERLFLEDPIAIAATLGDAGVSWLDVVDLDARRGEARNRLLISAMAQRSKSPIQAEAGIKDRATAEKTLDTGADRIVVPHGVTGEPGLIPWLATKYPGRITVAIPAKDACSASANRFAGEGSLLLDEVHQFSTAGVASFVITGIEHDLVTDKLDVAPLNEIIAVTDVDVFASGDINSLDDLKTLHDLSVGGYKKLAGAIVGRALFDNVFTVEQALEICTA